MNKHFLDCISDSESSIEDRHNDLRLPLLTREDASRCSEANSLPAVKMYRFIKDIQKRAHSPIISHLLENDEESNKNQRLSGRTASGECTDYQKISLVPVDEPLDSESIENEINPAASPVSKFSKLCKEMQTNNNNVTSSGPCPSLRRILLRNNSIKHGCTPVDWLSHLRYIESPVFSLRSCKSPSIANNGCYVQVPIDTIIDYEAILIKNKDFQEYLKIRDKQYLKVNLDDDNNMRIPFMVSGPSNPAAFVNRQK